MAVLDAWVVDYGLVGLTNAAYNPSIALEFFATCDAPSDTHTPLVSYSVTSNLPVSTTPLSLDASISGAWFDDYYYRVHVAPTKLDLGNLLSDQVRELEIWNAYLTDKVYTGFSSIGDISGIKVLNLSPMTVFSKNESKIVSISISSIGAPVIDAAIRFEFSPDTPTVAITGQRVVVFGYKPTQDFKEVLEWSTDVIKSKSRENRIALREDPRQIFAYNYVIDSDEYVEVQAIANKWIHRLFAIPVWLDKLYVGNVAEGVTSIPAATTNFDFRSNDLVLITNFTDSLAVETASVTSSVVNLKLPTTFAISNAFIVPLRYARLNGELSIARGSDQQIRAKSTFTVQLNQTPKNIASLPQFLGTPILLDDVYNSQPSTLNISRSVEVFDNQSGRQAVETLQNYNDATLSVNLASFNRSQLNRYRSLFGYLKGRQKTFFLPTKHSDLSLQADIAIGVNTLTVKSLNYELYYGVKYIVIRQVSGALIYKKIVSGSTALGVDVLTVSEPFASAIPVSSVYSISFMRLVRLNTDAVQINHMSGSIADISFTVIEVPDVV